MNSIFCLFQTNERQINLFADIEFDDGIERTDVTHHVPVHNAFVLLYFPNITELDLTGMTHMNPQDVVECISYVWKLQFVTLDFCTQFSPYHLMKIFQQLKECRWISLVRCQSLDWTPAYCITSSSSKLKFIEFEMSHRWTSPSHWMQLRNIFLTVRFGAKMKYSSN